MSEFLWATVTQIGPLRVKIDGDAAALLFTPESLVDVATLAVNDRVRVELSGARILIHGSAGSSFYTRTQADAAFYTKTQLNAGQLDTRYYTETEIDAMRLWRPAVATGIASSGATATLNSTTGEVTLPAGTTAVRVDGLLSAGYEYQAELDLMVQSGHSTDNSMWMRMSEGGTPNTASSYNTAGRWTQYNGVTDVYTVNGGNQCAVGSVSGAATYVEFRSLIFLSPWALSGVASPPKGWIYTFQSFTGNSARGVAAGGYTPPATTAFDGVYFAFNGSATGLAQGKIRFFKRKLT